MNDASQPSVRKVAIVHDWLVGGGAELVVEQLHKLYPEAPIYTSYCSDEWRQRLEGKVVTGWLQHLGKFRKYIPFLRIWWFTRLNFEGYDLVISSSGAEAKGIHTSEGTVHINYCHAPTHYYWSRYDEYMQHPGFGAFDGLARLGLRLLVGPLRRWDYRAAQRPDKIIVNSTHIQREVKKYYNRDSVVIHPPVSFERFQKPENKDLPRSGFVISGRQTPYKRFDLAVQACSQLKVPLKVIGDGPDNDRLRTMAGQTISFLGKIPDEIQEKELASATAFLFPCIDDFGISAIEALAAGTPVIAYQAGGALDYVQPGVTGEFFASQTAESLITVIQSFDPKRYNHATIRRAASSFSDEEFRQKLKDFIQSI
jgi:glycosyltransferase involved in cell wall biosynthesis